MTIDVMSKFWCRWSAFFPVFGYVIFLTFMFMLSPPLKSPENITVVEFDKIFDSYYLSDEKFGINRNYLLAVIDRNKRFDRELRERNDQILIRENAGKKNDPTHFLTDVFKRADINIDGALDLSELAKWINIKIQEHIAIAIRDNLGLFNLVDVDPQNGEITWNEYHTYFLVRQGYSIDYIKHHNEKQHVDMERSIKELMMRDKAAWEEVTKSKKNSLTVDEFLAFRHPESSATILLSLVDEILTRHDQDGDDIITENEYSIIDDNEKDSSMNKASELGRRKEFKYVIDKNKDGQADKGELLAYVDPKNPRHSIDEAYSLLNIADSDGDLKLNLSEMLNQKEVFLGSKMVDTNSFHDEF